VSTIEKVEWDEKYSVDIEEIDVHQKKMFELFNQLIDMKQSGADTKEFVKYDFHDKRMQSVVFQY